jgi:pre-mRNA-processing factor SLU7
MATSANSNFKSREEYKRAKELEEARKAGTAAPEVDEEGNDINPHIPQYISKVPWYFPSQVPTLKHQRNLNATERRFDELGKWYARGEKAGPAATRFRKGACENCGAMTHSRKDCLERPRAKGARWTGADIAADEVQTDVNLDWEGKRDRWNGYDAKNYRAVEERFTKLEAERMRLRAEKLDKAHREGKRAASDSSDGSSSEDEDLKEAKGPKSGTVGAKVVGESVVHVRDQAAQATARNLRIREDTAKYLRNLDVESAYYDPKTRSMRADPTPNVNSDDKDYAGDNFVRFTGDVKDLARMELHSLRAAEDGRELPHLQADPTTAEEVFKNFGSRKRTIEERRRAEILERYGDQQHLAGDPDILTSVRQSEAYVEYNRDGQILLGQEASRSNSKYTEDAYENNHTSVWGSFYANGKWGFACCHLLSRNAYCTGDAGKEATIEVEREMKAKTAVALEKRANLAQGELPNEETIIGNSTDISGRKRNRRIPESQDEGEKRRSQISDLRERDLAARMSRQDDWQRGFGTTHGSGDGATDAELENYRLQKEISEDPMANFISNSVLETVKDVESQRSDENMT